MVSMVGILIMTVLTVAVGRDKRMQVGPLLIVVFEQGVPVDHRVLHPGQRRRGQVR